MAVNKLECEVTGNELLPCPAPLSSSVGLRGKYGAGQARLVGEMATLSQEAGRQQMGPCSLNNFPA